MIGGKSEKSKWTRSFELPIALILVTLSMSFRKTPTKCHHFLSPPAMSRISSFMNQCMIIVLSF